MAGTLDNWQGGKIVLGPGKLYANLGGTNNAEWDVAVGTRLLLYSDGTPSSTQNPNAKHLGMTEGGEEWSVKPTKTDFFVDEFTTPIASRVTAEEVTISGSLAQINDIDVMAIMNPTAVRSDVASQGMTFGGYGTIVYRSFAVIWPVEGSTTLFAVFHIYKGYNNAGIAAQVTTKKLGFSPFVINGYGITTRTAGDQSGRFFVQVGGSS